MYGQCAEISVINDNNTTFMISFSKVLPFFNHITPFITNVSTNISQWFYFDTVSKAFDYIK